MSSVELAPRQGDKPLLSFGSGSYATQVALRIADELEFDQWLQIGQRVLAFHEALKFHLGDWLVHGEWAGYGDKYRLAIEELGLAYDRLRDYAYVANNVPAAVRRTDLTWAHHRVVAKLIPAEQEVWLDRAAAEGWSYRDLADQLNTALAPPPPEPEPDEDESDLKDRTAVRTAPADLEQVLLTVAAERAERWRAAAARERMEFEQWAAEMLDAACGG